MNAQEIKTPRVDAESARTQIDAKLGIGWTEPVSAQLARQLERELAVAEAALKICDEIQAGFADYESEKYSTPMGFEHLGDVWRQFREWNARIVEMKTKLTELERMRKP